jgi:integrase/recombinase XerD
MKNQNRSDYTIKSTNKSLTQISKHADLNNPEEVKQYIANKQNVSDGYKKSLCLAYNKYANYYQIQWEMPRYKQEARIRRIPTTENVNMLIAKARRTLSTKLTISKETGLRPFELCNLKVKDIDLEQRRIYPTTAKNGSARTLKISNSLQMMLQNHINKHRLSLNDKLFKGTAENYGKYYRQMRNNLAEKLGKPTLKTVRLYDFRHYYATRLYAKTRDILYVKQQLGHKKIETTLKYVQLLSLNEDDEYTCKTATTTKEATQLIENGFTYVTEIDGTKLFRKRK